MRKLASIFLLLLCGLVFFTILNARITNQVILSPQPDLSFNYSAQASGKNSPELTLANFSPTPTLVNLASLQVADTPTPTPSPTATPQPTQTPKPTIKLPQSPLPSPTDTPQPAVAPTSQMPANSLDGDKILSLINDHRKSIGLSELQKDQRSCDLAAARAPEIMHEVETGTMHAGLAARNLPYWNNENIAYYNTEEQTVNWWIADTIHRRQLEGNFKYSCVECYHNSCAQELTNFAPK